MKTKNIAAAVAILTLTAAVSYTAKTLAPSLEKPTSPTAEAVSSTFQKVESPIKFAPLHTGGTATFVLNNIPVNGKINTVQIDTNETTRVGGEFERGTFCFAIDKDSLTSGMIILPREGLVYVMEPTPANGAVSWVVRKLSEVACKDLVPDSEAAPSVPTSTSITTQDNVPIMNSRSGAKVTLFLDFIGGSITDPLWNGGKTINATPANYTADQMKTTFAVCAERYAAFNVNVTTDIKAYTSAPVKTRMRIVLTSNSFMSNYGGYAFISSLKLAGVGIYSPAIPCFVFVNAVGNAKNAGEVAAHEAGHTFGLTHDGTASNAYYSGQGNWAPVMGSSYSKTIVQWSKGEYNGANNAQDDISTIASVVGGGTISDGFVATNNSNTPIVLGGSLTAADVISNSTTARYYAVNVVSAGSLTLDVKVPQYGGLNAAIEVRDASGLTVLGKSNNPNDISTRIQTAVKPGKYIVKVYGEGDLDPKTNGYSAYGSIGSFVLAGTLSTGTLK